MKWLEIIELRSVGSNKQLLEDELKSLIKELNKDGIQGLIKVYAHNSVDSDFSIHLLHDSAEADINGSTLGLQLISTLKDFGLLNHNVWVEQIGV
jgi:hypothetical protein